MLFIHFGGDTWSVRLEFFHSHSFDEKYRRMHSECDQGEFHTSRSIILCAGLCKNAFPHEYIAICNRNSKLSL